MNQKLIFGLKYITVINICNFNKLNYKIIFFYHNSRNDISCDDELIYQPPNKMIKYDNNIISADFCNSDENSIG